MNQPLASGALPHNFSMDAVFSALKLNGAVVIPTDAFDIESFSRLIQSICRRITFDPAREYASSAAQTVDAGTAAVGLHIENGNTPLPPDIVSFYSARSAKTGAQTTLCDGIAVLAQMPKTLVSQFEKPFSMTRNLPKAIWQRYVATAFGLANADEVEQVHLDRFSQDLRLAYEVIKDHVVFGFDINNQSTVEYSITDICNNTDFTNAMVEVIKIMNDYNNMTVILSNKLEKISSLLKVDNNE